MKKLLIILVGIIVVIALIAGVLVVTSMTGVSQTQKSERDNVRRSTLTDANLVLNNYFSQNGTYPNTIKLTSNKIVISGNATDNIKLNGAAQGGADTTDSASTYCYTSTGNTYALGVKLETGDWYNLGQDKCGDSNKLPLMQS